jgi:hypothetical protein
MDFWLSLSKYLPVPYPTCTHNATMLRFICSYSSNPQNQSPSYRPLGFRDREEASIARTGTPEIILYLDSGHGGQADTNSAKAIVARERLEVLSALRQVVESELLSQLWHGLTMLSLSLPCRIDLILQPRTSTFHCVRNLIMLMMS